MVICSPFVKGSRFSPPFEKGAGGDLLFSRLCAGHQNKTAVTAVFGIEFHGGVSGGARTSKEIQNYVIGFVAMRRMRSIIVWFWCREGSSVFG